MLMAIWRLLTKIFNLFQALLDGQKTIQKQLAEIIDILKPGPAVKLIFTSISEDGTTIEGVTMGTLRDDQKQRLSINPVDAKGKPASLDGVPTWTSSDETVVTVAAEADGLSAMVTAVLPGTARVVVDADADLGSGVTPLNGFVEYTITGGTAVALTITEDPPASQ